VCIVIGAGIQGSCTAYQLAKNQQKTLLLEQVGYSMICRLFMIHSNVYTNVRKVPVYLIKTEYSSKIVNQY